MAKADSPTKTCGEDGCGRSLRARGLCSTHYNQIYQPNRYRKITVVCGWCGRSCEKAADASRNYAYRFCSFDCLGAMKAYEAGSPMLCALTRWHPAHPQFRPPLPVLWAPPARALVQPRARAPRVFVGGTCVRCGSMYLAEDYTDKARFCSRACYRGDAKDRRRARKRAAYVADVSRTRIFERDGWRCQLCRKLVRRDAVVPHPLAPTIDHIVALNRGGTHEPANVQCAHFICNSRKSDRSDAVQPMLFG